MYSLAVRHVGELLYRSIICLLYMYFTSQFTGICSAGCARPHTTTTLCLEKNDTDVAHYNFNANQPILVIFGRDIAE